MATSMFSKRHYEAVAEVLREVNFDDRMVRGEGIVALIRDRFAEVFEADNEKFNRTKWEEACE